jgi:hypothetical protein
MNMNELYHYCIEVKGHLDSDWQNWLDGLAINLTDEGNTRISGRILDQAALHGVLKKIRDLGMTILSVYPIENGDTNE